MPPEAPHPDIRQRLLQAASEVFAEFGYQNATVRDICARANANIAAVNYHFGGKDELYGALLQQHFTDNVNRFPLELSAVTDPEKGLTGFIRVTVQRMLDEQPSAQNQLVLREITEPTTHLDTIAEQFMKPHFSALRELLARLLGPDVPEHRQRMMALSVMGQVVFYKVGRHAIARVAPDQKTGPAELEEIAAHIAQVILAACRDLRKQYSHPGSTP